MAHDQDGSEFLRRFHHRIGFGEVHRQRLFHENPTNAGGCRLGRDLGMSRWPGTDTHDVWPVASEQVAIIAIRGIDTVTNAKRFCPLGIDVHARRKLESADRSVHVRVDLGDRPTTDDPDPQWCPPSVTRHSQRVYLSSEKLTVNPREN